jgi:hypothetical protein
VATEIVEAGAPEGTLTLQLTPAQLLALVQQVDEIKRAVLREGVDYGSPKRQDGRDAWPRPALYVSGAEKLLQAFGLNYRVEITRREEDPERGWWRYECTATILRQRVAPDGTVSVVPLGSATATANSREARWRHIDPWSLQDTVLAMAEKRALVRATRRTLALSGLFAEEAPDEDAVPADSRARRAAEQAVQAARRTGRAQSDLPARQSEAPSSPQQQVRIQAGRLRLSGLHIADLCRAVGASGLEIAGLTDEQASLLADALATLPEGTPPDQVLETVRNRLGAESR